MNRLIRVWVINPSQLPNSQYGAYSQHWYTHQCCCVVDCILQILFSSYHISLAYIENPLHQLWCEGFLRRHAFKRSCRWQVLCVKKCTKVFGCGSIMIKKNRYCFNMSWMRKANKSSFLFWIVNKERCICYARYTRG